MGSTRLACVIALLLGVGCSTGIQLTDRGTNVQMLTRAEMPPGCHVVGDVAIGIPPDAARPRTEEQLAVLMRNKAGEMGATHVLIEQSDQRTEGGTQHYVGRGSAYHCEPGQQPATPGEPGAAGAGGESAAEPTDTAE